MREDERHTRMRPAGGGLAAAKDFVMGSLLIVVGIIFLIYERMGWKLFRPEPSKLDLLAGGLFIIYGSWRLYRGFKKKRAHEGN